MQVCEEMQQLRKLLDEKNIYWEDASEELQEMWFCRTHFDYKGVFVSVVNGYGSYGGYEGVNLSDDNEGLLEMMVNGQEPIGWLTAQKCIDYLEEEKWN